MGKIMSLTTKAVRYVHEFRFAFQSALDFKSAFLLLKNTTRFHFHNIRPTHSKDIPFEVTLNVGNGSSISLRPFAGDIFVFYEVLMDDCYRVPDAVVDPNEVRTIVDCGGNIG